MAANTLQEDFEKRYEDQLELVKLLRAEWEKLGKPLLAKGGATGKADVPHPLVKMLSDAEALAHRFGQQIKGKKLPGRPPVAVPAIAASPAQKLRAVK